MTRSPSTALATSQQRSTTGRGSHPTLRNCLRRLLATGLLPMATLSQAEPVTVTLTIQDHRFTPSVLHVPTASELRLIVVNRDDTPEEFESDSLHREQRVSGKQQLEVFLRPLTPGIYGFFGDYHQDTAQGSLVAE